MVIQSTYMNILDINSIEYSLRLLDICCKYSYLRNRNCKSIKLYEYNKTLQGGGRGEHICLMRVRLSGCGLRRWDSSAVAW